MILKCKIFLKIKSARKNRIRAKLQVVDQMVQIIDHCEDKSFDWSAEIMELVDRMCLSISKPTLWLVGQFSHSIDQQVFTIQTAL